MKKITFLFLITVIAAVMIAGCAGTPPTPVPAPTTIPPTGAVVTAAESPAVPAQLENSEWILTKMGIQDGTAVTDATAEITLKFSDGGTLSGNGGCNNYNGPFTLTGETTAKGKGISIGPLVSTKVYCQEFSSQETMYLNILQKAMAYNVNGDQLSITATTGDVLIYQTPSSIGAQV